MAAYSFANSINHGNEIVVFLGPEGQELSRDFTFISDIVSGIAASIDKFDEDPSNMEPRYHLDFYHAPCFGGSC
jgi:hypothetical protein